MTDNNYQNKFGMVNLLTDEEKASYKEFAHKVQAMDNNNLNILNAGMADNLTSEMKDIVSWEIKRRELDFLKKNNIDANKEFEMERAHKVNFLVENGIDVSKVQDIDGVYNQIKYPKHMKDLNKWKFVEKQKLSEMSDELLENSKKIVKENPPVININDLHKTFGGGINYMAEKYIVIDNNGKKIHVNNKKIQDHFRKMYMNRMSEVTGIDYTQYDIDLQGYESDEMYKANDNNIVDNSNMGFNPNEINYDDYEDD